MEPGLEGGTRDRGSIFGRLPRWPYYSDGPYVLENQAEQLVAENWPAIEGLANALLSKQLEPLKPFESGTQWSEAAMAKYVTGDEIVEILGRFDVTAQCVQEC